MTDSLDQILDSLWGSRDLGKAWETAEAALLKWRDRAVVAELKKLRDAFYDNSPTFDGDELTRRIKQLEGAE